MKVKDLEHFLFLNRGAIKMLFGDLSSVITISDDYPFMHILHASLGDFLRDVARSKEFYIKFSSIHTACKWKAGVSSFPSLRQTCCGE